MVWFGFVAHLFDSGDEASFLTQSWILNVSKSAYILRGRSVIRSMGLGLNYLVVSPVHVE